MLTGPMPLIILQLAAESDTFSGSIRGDNVDVIGSTGVDGIVHVAIDAEKVWY